MQVATGIQGRSMAFFSLLALTLVSLFSVSDAQAAPRTGSMTSRVQAPVMVGQARPANQILCVSVAGGQVGSPCTNPGNVAYTTIQAAVSAAVAGDEIRIAGGTYTGSGSAVATLTVPVVVTGGYPGGTNGWSTSNDATSTVVDGQGARKGFIVQDAISVTIQNLLVNNGGIQNDSGTVNVGSGPLPSGRINLINGGTTSGVFNISSSSDVRFPQGAQLLAGGTTFSGLGAGLLEGGTVTIGTTNASVVNAQNFIFNSGTLTGPGAFNVSGSLLWNGGMMDSPTTNPGVTNIQSGATVVLGGSGGAKYLQTRTLNQLGTFNLSSTGGGGVLVMNNGAVFNNGSGPGSTAVLNFQNDDSIAYGSGARPTFHNYGSIHKAAGTGVSTLGTGGVGFMLVQNDGSISADTGTLSMDCDSTDTGLFGSLPSARLRFNGGTHNLQNSTVSATGDLEVSTGLVISNGSYNVSGTTYVTGNGILELNGTVTMGALVVQGSGTLRGTATSVINGVAHWAGGIWSGAGVTRITNTGVLHIDGVNATHVLDNRSIENYGTIAMDGTGTGVLLLSNSASITNESGASFNILNNDSVAYQTGSASRIVNIGTINKAGGSGTPQNPPYTQFGTGFLTFENRLGGTVNAITGTLSLDGGNTNVQGEGHGGTFLVSPGATLRFNAQSNSTRFLNTSSVTGQGNFEVVGGTVNVAAGTYNMSGPGETRVLGGTLNFDTDATTRNLTLSGGTLGTSPNSGPFTLTITNLFNWNGGTMSGSNNFTHVTNTAALYFGGVNSTKVLTGRTFNNDGSAVVNGTGTGVVLINDGATFNNNGSATFDFQNNDSILYNNGVASAFNNAGTLTKSGGALISTLGSGNLAFNNSGTVNVMTGTLSLDGGTTNCSNCGHTGHFLVQNLTSLRFNGGTHTIQPSASITGTGSVEFSQGTADIAGAYAISGTTKVTGGTANFNTSATSVSALLSSGTLGGNGTFNITGLLNWTGGTMTGDPTTGQGVTSVAAGATLNIGGVSATKVLTKRTFNNYGTAYVNGTGTGVLLVNDGATFNNNSGATLDIRNNDSFAYSGGSASLFNNSGTLSKTIGAGVSTIGNGNLSFNNTGSVSVLTGTVSFDGGGTDTGSVDVGSVAVVRFNGGTHNYQTGSSLQGAGNVDFTSGTVNMAGNYNVTGQTDIAGGIISFVSGGTSANTLITTGSLTGPGTFTTTQLLNWNGGTMDGSGVTNVAQGAVMNLGGVGTPKFLVQRTFNNRGTVTMNGTQVGSLNIANGATFNNSVGATFNIQNNDNIAFSGGANATFHNDGTFRKSAGTGTSNIATSTSFAFINTGTVDVDSGVLGFSGGYQQNSGTTYLGGGDISSTGPINYLDGDISGTGAITSTVNNTAAHVSPGGPAGGQIYGTLAIYGNYTMGSGANLDIDIAGLDPGTTYDQLKIQGTAALTGTLNLNTASGYLPDFGDTFHIVTYTSHTGSFPNINGWYIGSGRAYRVVAPANGTNFDLVVQDSGPTPTATPTGSRTPSVTTTPLPGSPTVTPTAGSATPTATSCPVNFSDVQPSDYFYQAVVYLYCEGAISGYSDGTFRPYNNTTRGQLSKIVVNAMGYAINLTGAPHFVDVPSDNAFYVYIETAYNNNLISGYSCGAACLEFRPFNNITRGQLAKIIVNAKGWTQVCPPPGHFSDVPVDNPFFCYIETAYAHGVISGYSDGTFRPGNNATRGQISKIVYNAVTQPSR